MATDFMRCFLNENEISVGEYFHVLDNEDDLLRNRFAVNMRGECYYLSYALGEDFCDSPFGVFTRLLGGVYKVKKIKHKTFSALDKEFLEAYPNIKYVARDEDGKLYGYNNEIRKEEHSNFGGFWCATATTEVTKISSLYRGSVDYSQTLFRDVLWEDEEPVSREEVLSSEE